MLIEELFPPKLIVTNEQYHSAVVPGVHLFYATARNAPQSVGAKVYIGRLK